MFRCAYCDQLQNYASYERWYLGHYCGVCSDCADILPKTKPKRVKLRLTVQHAKALAALARTYPFIANLKLIEQTALIEICVEMLYKLKIIDDENNLNSDKLEEFLEQYM